MPGHTSCPTPGDRRDKLMRCWRGLIENASKQTSALGGHQRVAYEGIMEKTISKNSGYSVHSGVSTSGAHMVARPGGKRFVTRLSMPLAAAAAFGCAQTPHTASSASSATGPELISCPAQRPQMCTRQYQPVCAVEDTGVRCVTTPCPSTVKRTYGNACDACSRPKVSGYVPGACTPQS